MINHFNFKKVNGNHVLITNDFGQHLFLSDEEFKIFILHSDEMSDELNARLADHLFILNPSDLYSSEVNRILRDMKSYVFSATSLHIFVVTNACNLRCEYCQAQAEKVHKNGYMSFETGKKAIDIALQSPAGYLTFEFQGGEPLENFTVIKQMIEYSESAKLDKQIQFTIVSNLSLATEEILSFLIDHNVSISTSLDGPRILHDSNRRALSGESSYEYVVNAANRIRELGAPLGAIQTTTRASLCYAKEIVHEYVDRGLTSLFLRPLTPLGFAKNDWDRIGYSAEEFLTFYREAFWEIIKVNQSGTCFPEQHATYFLKKILHNFSPNYMELRSPCGAGLGQMAYYYDGSIYTCDEARMVAEAGDAAFCIGHVDTSSYNDIITSGPCRAVCASSVLESIPYCCDCVYQPYCGVCPVVNYASYGDLFVKGAKTFRCKVFSGILDFLFELIYENNPDILRIFYSWIEEGHTSESCREEAKAE